jgi:outer membrane protein OmpA-like peptidoglycan-associated protein
MDRRDTTITLRSACALCGFLNREITNDCFCVPLSHVTIVLHRIMTGIVIQDMKRLFLASFALLIGSLTFAQSPVPLKPTETQALLHVIVTDFAGKATVGEPIFFESTNTGKTVQRKTDAEGKFDILLPKGDIYKIKYQGFLDEKESSTIEIPSGKGLGEATLTVQMENESNEVFALDVHYETAKATIRPESYAVLNDLVAAMKRDADARIELAGHTDSDGSDEANLELSRDRAAAVRAYLVQKGIAGDRIETVGHGETQPVATNATEAGKAQNRRTEVRVIE